MRDASDLGIEAVDDHLVDDRRPDEDAEADGQEDRDERDEVEPEADHRQNQPRTRDHVSSNIRRKPSRNTRSECDA